jgi:hypothetical protein
MIKSNSENSNPAPISSARYGVKSALYGGCAGLFSSVVLQP